MLEILCGPDLSRFCSYQISLLLLVKGRANVAFASQKTTMSVGNRMRTTDW